MSAFVAAGITAVVLLSAFVSFHVWERRHHRGRRSRYDDNNSAYSVIDAVESNRWKDDQESLRFRTVLDRVQDEVASLIEGTGQTSAYATGRHHLIVDPTPPRAALEPVANGQRHGWWSSP